MTEQEPKDEEMAAPNRPNLDEWWPVHPTARLAEGVSLRREDMYEERVELPKGTASPS